MGVLAADRGRGIGERLLRACLAKAPAKGITRVELRSARRQRARDPPLRAVGFEHEAAKRNAMCFDGVYYDAVQMSLLLDDEPHRRASVAAAAVLAALAGTAGGARGARCRARPRAS